MNWLPIADRELRVAARKTSTFWVRLAAALTALVIGSACFTISALGQTSLAQIGSVLFAALSWLSMAAVLSAGPFFTADSLSEEKREGTLGLLFVTELRGYDVVMGKLLATSLRAFYALLALLPVLAVTELMGGVTGAQYWKSSLALVNALWLSLAVGVFVSALSRDSQKALTATVFLVLLLALAGPLADAIIAAVKNRAFRPFWSLCSPGYVLVAASAWGRSSYWTGLLVTHLLGWALFVLACGLVPRTWQERKRTGLGSSRSWGFAWKYGGVRRRLRLRRKLLDWQPIAWLGCRECWQSRALWIIAALVVVGFFVVLNEDLPQGAWFIWNYVGGLFTLLIYVWAASQACRMLVEARRSGLLELMLVTPVSVRQIVTGQWRALWTLFGIPVLLLVGLHMLGATLSQLSRQRVAVQAAAVAASGTTNQSVAITNQSSASSTTIAVSVSRGSRLLRPQNFQQGTMAAGAALAAGLSTAANLLALGWFGMWMGLSSKTANVATLKTLLFVQIIPWFVITLGSAIVLGLIVASVAARTSALGRTSTWLVWWPLMNSLLGAVLAIGKDVGFIIWSRKRLLLAFREQAARTLGVVQFAASPFVRSPILAPPKIEISRTEAR